MNPRAAVILGLVAGLATAALAFVAILAVAPDSTARPTPAPSIDASPSPTSSVSAATASTSPSPSAPAGSGATASAGASGSATGAFMIGRPAPALKVPQLGGGTIDLSVLRGKPVWLNFMATWCPSCRDELPRMNTYAARYEGTGLVIIAIDSREDPAIVAPYMSSLDVAFPVGLDVDGSAQSAWGAYALPVHFWIDAQGIVRDGALGGIGPDVMAAGLSRILPGVTVKP